MKAFPELRTRFAAAFDSNESASKEDEEFRDRYFVRNAREAREDGYDLVCVHCGYGVNSQEEPDPFMHETWCPEGSDQVEPA